MGFVKSILGGKSGAGFQAQGPSAADLAAAQANTTSSIKQQQDFVNATNAQGGLGNQSNVFGQEQALSNQFGQIAQGQGPNPAQAALNQATGQNITNQAALMAGQRGAGANTGLLARQAAMQGGNIQQQAVGQGATMQAQQEMAAMQAQQAQQAQMANLANTQVGQQQAGLANLGQQSLGQQSNLMGLQQNANNANASIAAQNANKQGGILSGLATGLGGALMGGLGGALKSGIAGMFSGAGGPGAGNMAGVANVSHTGNTTTYTAEAEGGEIHAQGPRSSYGKKLHGIPMAKGGKVPALVSPGEVYLKPKDVKEVAKGKKAPMSGEKIPGKPKVGGAKNDYANDTVPKSLDEGGIILPRSVTQSPDSDRKSIEFVQAILAKHHKSLPKK